ncbi:Glycosyltransferase Family 39 protein [Gigaspora rosea]|uniref:Dolichyl-phosphate-mannose--protein mannosyltransferase n=1 Tax=Gigaspora rosea TaxID=44941 RepID=A0A397W4M8_9GLOM|nr:Glycosyltransferase Family 39 protein [Gigaspora rosea]
MHLKFGSHYLKREFYFDVHPPLGKMLVGLAGLLAGNNTDVNYGFMRIFFAPFSDWMVPLAYFTAIELDFSHHAMILAILIVLLNTAYLCISHFILLDSMLLFFTFTTLFFLTKFHNQRYNSFFIDWWLWLILTRVSIGCVTSVKWVGLFATALVGLYNIEYLWDKFGDLSMPKTVYFKHLIARIICLIILPIQIYMLCFAIHFAILYRSGLGDVQMSSLFQAGLHGNNFYGNPIDLAYSSKFILKNMEYGGGLLHSHVQTYPSGSKQQQVTCYHHRDANNDWFIKKIREESEENKEEKILNFNYDLLENTPRIRANTTRLRFCHKILDCYLQAANAVLPQWGFKQIEVTCDKKNNLSDSFTHWNVEHHWNDKLPPGGSSHYRTLFLHNFWHLNVAIYTSNNALIPDPDKKDILTSHPLQWPLLQVGIQICGWDDKAIKYYLLINPIVCKICLIRWLLHFMPFFIMGCVTYLHHYFSALYFSILMCAFVLDHLTSSCNQITKHIVFGISYLAVILVFWYFKDIAFEFDYPSIELKGRQWVSS